MNSAPRTPKKCDPRGALYTRYHPNLSLVMPITRRASGSNKPKSRSSRCSLAGAKSYILGASSCIFHQPCILFFGAAAATSFCVTFSHGLYFSINKSICQEADAIIREISRHTRSKRIRQRMHSIGRLCPNPFFGCIRKARRRHTRQPRDPPRRWRSKR